MVIAFSYPFCIITKTIVEEKVLRLKEGYRILGGSNSAYLVSYALFYYVMFSITALFLTWLLCANIYTRTDPTVLFVTINLFGLNMISLSMLIATLFNQPKLSAVMAWLGFLVTFFLYRFVEEAPEEKTKNSVCISGPSAFGLGLVLPLSLSLSPSLSPLFRHGSAFARRLAFVSFPTAWTWPVEL